MTKEEVEKAYKEAIETLKEMATELQIHPMSKQGKVFLFAIDALKEMQNRLSVY